MNKKIDTQSYNSKVMGRTLIEFENELCECSSSIPPSRSLIVDTFSAVCVTVVICPRCHCRPGEGGYMKKQICEGQKYFP